VHLVLPHHVYLPIQAPAALCQQRQLVLEPGRLECCIAEETTWFLRLLDDLAAGEKRELWDGSWARTPDGRLGQGAGMG
jgi:hypothetical protein